jgi:hypothetical protein
MELHVKAVTAHRSCTNSDAAGDAAAFPTGKDFADMGFIPRTGGIYYNIPAVEQRTEAAFRRLSPQTECGLDGYAKQAQTVACHSMQLDQSRAASEQAVARLPLYGSTWPADYWHGE